MGAALAMSFLSVCGKRHAMWQRWVWFVFGLKGAMLTGARFGSQICAKGAAHAVLAPFGTDLSAFAVGGLSVN